MGSGQYNSAPPPSLQYSAASLIVEYRRESRTHAINNRKTRQIGPLVAARLLRSEGCSRIERQSLKDLPARNLFGKQFQKTIHS